MESVKYWKTKDRVEARLIHDENGLQVLKMEGEKYPFPGFPRGHILFGKLSKLKHEIKNRIFNDSWKLLEEGKPLKIRETLPNIFTLLEDQKYDIVPPDKLVPPVKEIHRAWTKIAKSDSSRKLRDVLCHIIQEDDGYRFRTMDMAEYFNPNLWWKKIYRFIFRKNYADSIIKDLEIALIIIENCEIIGDMKERQRLLKRVLLAVLQDRGFRKSFEELCREIDWKKVYLTKADRYFFRGKWYKTDYRLFDY